MIHEKLNRDPRDLVGDIALKAYDTARAMQTRKSGSITVHNADGTKTITGPILGQQNGSSITQATHVGDKVAPPPPTGISISSSAGMLTVHWNGSLSGGMPADFSNITIYVSPIVNNSRVLGVLTNSGDLVSSNVVVGTTYTVSATSEDDVCNIDGTPNHNVSSEVEIGKITIEELTSEDKEARESAEAAKQLAQESKDIANAANTASTEANDKVNASRQYFFDDSNGIHVTNTENDPNGSKNIILNSLGILLRAYENNLLSVTPSGITIFDGHGNEDTNITSMFEGNRIELGHNSSTDNHISITPVAVNILNGTKILSSFRPAYVMLGSQTDKNVKVTDSGININDAYSTLASFNSDSIFLGKNSNKSVIDLCNGSGNISLTNLNGISTLSVNTNKHQVALQRSHLIEPGETTTDDYLGYTQSGAFTIGKTTASNTAVTAMYAEMKKGNDRFAAQLRLEVGASESATGTSSYLNIAVNNTVNGESHFNAVVADLSKVIDLVRSADTTMSDWVYIYGSGENGNVLNTVKYKAINGICYMVFDINGISTNGWYCPTKLPDEYMPEGASYIGATDYPSGSPGLVWLSPRRQNDRGPWFMNTGNGRLVGTISWPYI